MAKQFPITKNQFYEWLRARPRARAGTWCDCPLEHAVKNLTGKAVNVTGSGPLWVVSLAKRIDELTNSEWEKFTRGQLLKLLEKAK